MKAEVLFHLCLMCYNGADRAVGSGVYHFGDSVNRCFIEDKE